MKKGVLGKGLNAIFMDNAAVDEDGRNIAVIRLSNIEPRADQPRKSFDEEALCELAASIAANGVLQPIAVRPTADGFYEIIAGERRWRAAKKAALTEIPAIVLNIDDQKAAELALIENIQREDLNAAEEAMAYRTLQEEYGLTQEELSQRIGKSRSAIANTMRLLELPPQVLKLLENGKLSAGHARALLGLQKKDQIETLANIVINKNLSVRETEATVRRMNSECVIKPDSAQTESLKIDYVKDLERQIQKYLGRKVAICSTGNKKYIQIDFRDNTDLDTLLELLCGKDRIQGL